MGDHSPSRPPNNSVTQEIRTSVASNDERQKGASPADVSIDIPSTSGPRRIYRVPPQLRGENNQSVYDPVVLSIGPYHHGEPRFRRVEKFKDEVLTMLIPTSEHRNLLHRKMLDRIEEIKSHYEEVEYTDEEWADLILRDACFLVYYMAGCTKLIADKLHVSLGISTVAFLYRDLVMLENQIPLWIIRSVLELIFHEDGEGLLRKFFSVCHFGDFDGLTALPWEDNEHEPLHLLEAIRTVKMRQETATGPITVKKIRSSVFNKALLPFRSVTDLRAKGIYFEPSSRCLKDFKFISYFCYGVLRLPTVLVNNSTKVFFSNLIAYEMSPETVTDGTVMSYVNFMKTLIENPRDVKELRRKGVLFSTLANDEEVVKLFSEINTYGAHIYGGFEEVKTGIEGHCSSKAKTWMAEFFHTYLQNPCTTIALLAATLLLCLTFLQTYFTIHPAQ